MLVRVQGQHLASNPKYATPTPQAHTTCMNGSRDMKMKFVTVRSFPIARHGRRNERLNDNDEEEHADVADGVEPVHCEGLRVTHDRVAGSGGLAGRARPANLERPSKASHCRP